MTEKCWRKNHSQTFSYRSLKNLMGRHSMTLHYIPYQQFCEFINNSSFTCDEEMKEPKTGLNNFCRINGSEGSILKLISKATHAHFTNWESVINATISNPQTIYFTRVWPRYPTIGKRHCTATNAHLRTRPYSHGGSWTIWHTAPCPNPIVALKNVADLRTSYGLRPVGTTWPGRFKGD